jgi:DNA-binding NtrC family response regulator
MAGYTVLIATRAHEALALFRTHDVDLVLTEHVAPATVDGPTLPAAMKMLTSDVPVAILSADVHASSEVVKLYAADFCGVHELRNATRELVEDFINELASQAATDRTSLLSKLNSYAPTQEGAA